MIGNISVFFQGGLPALVQPWGWALVKVTIVVTVLMSALAYVTLAERKIIAFMQLRVGPNRAGWHGILQPIADGIKLQFKEGIIPAHADKWLYVAAPVVSIVFALIPFALVPFTKTFYITDINIGLIFVMAMGSAGFIGLIIAGWSSGSKYSLLGSMRALALMISFEVPMVMAIMGVVTFTRSLSLVSIVEYQYHGWFVNSQPMAFAVFLLCGVAETQRIPFDMLEDEGTLVCGFLTEYSGMRFALHSLAEYANMFMFSSLTTILFLGGWQRPLASWPILNFLNFIPSIFWFSAKVLTLMFVYIWLRASLPRVRYDQLTYLCWKILLPLTIINIMLTSLYLLMEINILVFYLVNIMSALGWLKFYEKTKTWNVRGVSPELINEN